LTLILARFEREYGYYRPIVKAAVGKGLDCANPRCGRRFSWMSRTARIIDHLKLTFAAEKPPPSHVFEKVTLMAAEAAPDYLS
jgi:hypothetical protein